MAAKRKNVIDKKKDILPKENRCVVGLCEPMRVQGLKTDLQKGSTNKLISIKGPGLLLAGEISKQGGSNDLTFVSLRIDGQSVIDISYAALSNWGLTQANPYGLVLLKGGSVQTLTFGWPVPLTFRKSLELTATVKEAGVVQIVANILRGVGP